MRIVVLLVSLMILGGGCRSSPRDDRPRAAPPRVESLSWITGHWVSDRDGVRTEEHWTEPRGGTMLGSGRTLKGDRTVFFEYLRIEQTPDGLVYFASPNGRAATPFKLIEHSRHRAVFENPDHDFPQRIHYWLDSSGQLNARIEGVQRGQPASESWTYRPMRYH